METMFEEFKLGTARLVNRFVFPPIKLACGNPNGTVTERQLQFEVARYIAWPAQALTYKIGMNEILRLRAKAADQLGDRFDIRAFHNVVLGNGAVPLTILERIVDEYIAANQGS